jgi:7-cyano-7-deazaguanine synthase
MKKAVVLVSGGLDSAAVLAIAKADDFEVYALSFAYGQRHHVELSAAKKVVENIGVSEHKVVNLDMRAIGGSCLTDDIHVPKDRVSMNRVQIDENHVVPVTYVPARNTIFLSFALAYAEVIGSFDIFYGANAVDFSDYPDCRPDYVQAFERLAELATKTVSGTSFRIHAPLINLTKAEIIQFGTKLGVDFSLTHSCYDPIGNLACGHCDSCLFRRRGFLEANIQDPTHYF